MEHKQFEKGQKVQLIGNNNPFNGDTGIFKKYGGKTNSDKLFVKVDSTKRKHWFYFNEVGEIKNEHQN